MTRIAVVICTLNRQESCLRTLRSLAQQTVDDFAVCVVDNGGTDGTAAAVQAYAADFPVPLDACVEPTPGLSAARNRGARECLQAAGAADAELDEGDLALVFLDDDVIAVPGLIEAYRKAFSDPEVAAAGGKIVPKVP
ncbi:MAG: glycosyltransferase family A protein, partial [Planctomycetota bacterium]